MNREEKIIEIAKRVFNERYPASYEQICENYKKHNEQILADFYQCVRKLIHLTQKRQTACKKGPIRYFAAAYLLSSTLTETFDFQLSLLDEQYYLDPIESCIYWHPSFLFVNLAADKEELVRAVDREMIRVHSYELDMVWRSYVCEFYYVLAGLFFAENVKSAALAGGMNELTLTEEVQFVYGGVMDRALQFELLKKEAGV